MEINTLTRDVIAARRASVAESSHEVAQLLKASHASLEVRCSVSTDAVDEISTPASLPTRSIALEKHA